MKVCPSPKKIFVSRHLLSYFETTINRTQGTDMYKILIAILLFTSTLNAEERAFQLSLTPDVAIHHESTIIKGVALNIWGENEQRSINLGFINGHKGNLMKRAFFQHPVQKRICRFDGANSYIKIRPQVLKEKRW